MVDRSYASGVGRRVVCSVTVFFQGNDALQRGGADRAYHAQSNP